jgi:acetyl-CoA carboxylase carboxyl transferase subunit beta
MNWLTNFVRPKIRKLVRKKEMPEALWEKCPNCGQMIHHTDLEANLYVCAHCDHHMRLDPKRRFAQIFDDGEHQRIELPEATPDPLKFRDEKRYAERLKETRARTGEDEAVVVAHGTLGGNPVVVVAQNFAFMGGSLGLAAGEALVTAARLAVLQEAALIVFAAAGGARMQEGILSLMQMPRTTIAVDEVREAGLPYIVVLTDPTTGGVTASYAMLGDVAIAEPGALIGFAGPRVIENTIREKLPEGFQRAEYLLEHGMLDMVVHRRDLRDRLVRLVDLLRNRRPSAEVVALPQEDLEIPVPDAPALPPSEQPSEEPSPEE